MWTAAHVLNVEHNTFIPYSQDGLKNGIKKSPTVLDISVALMQKTYCSFTKVKDVFM